MSAPPWLAVAALGACSAFAGCAATPEGPPRDGPTDAANQRTATTTATPRPGATANGAGPPAASSSAPSGPGNATANGTTGAWTRIQFSGNLTGSHAGVFGPRAVHAFNVTPHADVLWLDLTVNGDALAMSAHPPGCGNATCRTQTTTHEGTATLKVAWPAPGTWSVRVEPPSAGRWNSTYLLDVAFREAPPARD